MSPLARTAMCRMGPRPSVTTVAWNPEGKVSPSGSCAGEGAVRNEPTVTIARTAVSFIIPPRIIVVDFLPLRGSQLLTAAKREYRAVRRRAGDESAGSDGMEPMNGLEPLTY